MKSRRLASIVCIAGVFSLTGGLPVVAVGFTEDFESGLGQWTGKSGGSHNGIVVSDPLASGRSNVLSFSDFGYGGDVFSATPISLSGPVVISFDYLGLAEHGSNPGDLGGFLGIAYSLNPIAEGTDIFWYAGTVDSYPGLLATLADDGLWHHYELTVDGDALGAFRLTLEDFSGSGGVCGDVYFDNIFVAGAPTQVPEPTVAGLGMIGGMAALLMLRRRN